jgi:hypothetical protein
MATAPECITRFEREGVFAASPERMGRALRERAPGSWPASPIGGGGASPHVTNVHIANFLIAQTGFVPSEAANALATLDDVKLRHYRKSHMVPGGGAEHGWPEPLPTLREFLETEIDAAADPTWRDSLADWTLIMCAIDPPWAELIGRVANYQYVVEFRRIGGLRPPRGEHVECVVRIPRQVLMICGELWADSKARLATKDENADPPARGPAPSTAPTAQRRKESPTSPNATARVCAPATSQGGPHGRQRRRSPVSVASGAA